MKRRVLTAIGLSALLLSGHGTLVSADEGFVSQDASGNDPRDFGTKFMPYYRYMEMENDVEVNSFTAFGFFAFNNRFGMTYELPLAQEIDYSDVDAFKNFDPEMGGDGGFLPPQDPCPALPADCR